MMGQISIIGFLFIPQWNTLLYLTALGTTSGVAKSNKSVYFSCNYFCLVPIRKPERLNQFVSSSKATFIEFWIAIHFNYLKEIYQRGDFKEKDKLIMRLKLLMESSYAPRWPLGCLEEIIYHLLFSSKTLRCLSLQQYFSSIYKNN